jgi:hypothetical protein
MDAEFLLLNFWSRKKTCFATRRLQPDFERIR